MLTKQKKFESDKIELKNNSQKLKDGLNEIKKCFVVKNKELNNVNLRIQDIREINETKGFDFFDIPKDEDVNLNQFFNIAEKMWFYTKTNHFFIS